ncbi:MAG: tetratricopeptide repeat protein, partial [Nannocystaceae bacterium]
AQIEQARDALGRALEQLPDDPGLVGNAQEMLARVEMTAVRARSGVDSLAQTPDLVAAALDRALAAYVEAEDPVGQANVWLRRADLALLSGDYAAGDNALSQAASLYRDHKAEAGLAATEHLHGDLARNQGNLEDATKHYQEALELYRKLGDRTGEASVTTSMGKLLLARGEKQAATKSFEQAGKIFADNGHAGLERKLQEQTASIAELTKVEPPKDPPTADELVTQARVALGNKQRLKAEKLLRQATDLKPDDADALSFLARVLMEENKWAESEAVLIRVLT